MDCDKSQNKSNLTANHGNQSDTSDNINIVENYLSDGDVLMISDMESKPDEKWILDTACVFHMCPNQNLFETY